MYIFWTAEYSINIIIICLIYKPQPTTILAHLERFKLPQLPILRICIQVDVKMRRVISRLSGHKLIA